MSNHSQVVWIIDEYANMRNWTDDTNYLPPTKGKVKKKIKQYFDYPKTLPEQLYVVYKKGNPDPMLFLQPIKHYEYTIDVPMSVKFGIKLYKTKPIWD